MCCEGNCFFFIPVKTGSLIFGYTIAVISALGVIAFTGLVMYLAVLLTFASGMGHLVASAIIADGFLTEFLSSFVCSVLLLIGIKQNKPSLVKSFIIYGTVHMVLLFICFIMLYCMNSSFTAGFLFLSLALIGIYILCLLLVFRTYQLMTRENGHVNFPISA